LVGETKRKERVDRGIKVRTERLYALLGWQEIGYLVAPRLALILILLLAPLLLGKYWQKVFCSAGVFALLAIAFDFLAHYVGLVCLGGAFFTGVGAYIVGILNSTWEWSPLLTIPIATIGGGILCTLLLLPCLPLRGVYFAMVTIIYPIAATRIIVALNIWGSTEGISGLTYFPNIWVEQYLMVAVVLLVLFGLRRVVGEDYGIVLRGIKDNDQAIRACGMNITWYKAQAVFIASAIGCFAGSYLACLYGWSGLSSFALDFSIIPIAATVLGGPRTLVGPVVGAFILTPLSEMLRAIGTWRIVLYCLILLVFIVFKPEGLMNWVQRKYHQFERWVEV